MTDKEPVPVAGNGLLDRRSFLRTGLAGGAMLLSAKAPGAEREPWMNAPGVGLSELGLPSDHEAHVERIGINVQTGTTGAGVSRTPLEHLDGIITPSRLHFERHHSGIPQIDPDLHRLIVHGLVERPLSFDLDSLARYPMTSNIHFLECSGNSFTLLDPTPPQRTCGELHGLVSVSEWGGVPLSILLEEAGLRADAGWIVAEGADAAVMSRSIPLDKALDDAIVALYQNGERLRPSNGYPMRLFLPGWEGNASVKWLRSIKVTAEPAMSREETSKYTDLQSDGRSLMFSFPMGVKSVITNPSYGFTLAERGIYQISGIAWSGAGRIARVEVSADGGQSWADAALDTHVLPICVTRFRAAWRWDGGPAIIMSRAIDESGNIQPTREVVRQGRPNEALSYHVNAIQAWRIDQAGAVTNVHA